MKNQSPSLGLDCRYVPDHGARFKTQIKYFSKPRLWNHFPPPHTKTPNSRFIDTFLFETYLIPTMAAPPEPEIPWHAALPAPRNQTPSSISRSDVLQLVRQADDASGRDFVLIDLRRLDHEVVTTPILRFNLLSSNGVVFVGVITDVWGIHVGRNYSRVSESPRADAVSVHSRSVFSLPRRRREDGHLVLWFVGPFVMCCIRFLVFPVAELIKTGVN